jgi:hypothetical protein
VCKSAPARPRLFRSGPGDTAAAWDFGAVRLHDAWRSPSMPGDSSRTGGDAPDSRAAAAGGLVIGVAPAMEYVTHERVLRGFALGDQAGGHPRNGKVSGRVSFLRKEVLGGPRTEVREGGRN